MASPLSSPNFSAWGPSVGLESYDAEVGRRAQQMSGSRRATQAAASVPAPPPVSTSPDVPPAQPPGKLARARSAIRTGAGAVGTGLLYGGAGAVGYAGARTLGGLGDPSLQPVRPSQPLSGADAARQALVDQIPTDGYPLAPSAQKFNAWTDTELGRNVGNTVNALAPLAGAAALLRAPGTVGRTAGIAAGSSDVMLGGFAAGVRQERDKANGSAAPKPSPSNPYANITPEMADAMRAINAKAGNNPLADPSAPTNPNGFVTRNGNSYSGTNVSGDISINGFAPGAGGMGGGGFMVVPGGAAMGSMDSALNDARRAALSRGDLASVGASYGNSGPADPRAALMGQLQSRVIGARKSARLALAAMDSQDQNLTARRGQDLTYDSAMRNQMMQNQIARSKLAWENGWKEREFGLNVDKFVVEKSANALKQREASEKALRDQILGQLPLVKDPESGKMIPDEQGAAQYVRSALARVSDRQDQLRKALTEDPKNQQAAAELASLEEYGLAAMSADPAAKNKFMAGMEARNAARNTASWWNPAGADRAAGSSSKPVTSLKRDDGTLFDGYRDQDGNWIPARAIDNVNGDWFGAPSNKFDRLKQE